MPEEATYEPHNALMRVRAWGSTPSRIGLHQKMNWSRLATSGAAVINQRDDLFLTRLLVRNNEAADAPSETVVLPVQFAGRKCSCCEYRGARRFAQQLVAEHGITERDKVGRRRYDATNGPFVAAVGRRCLDHCFLREGADIIRRASTRNLSGTIFSKYSSRPNHRGVRHH